MDRGAWQPTVHMITKSDTTEVTKHSYTYMYTHMQYTYNIQLYTIGLLHLLLLLDGEEWKQEFRKPILSILQLFFHVLYTALPHLIFTAILGHR